MNITRFSHPEGSTRKLLAVVEPPMTPEVFAKFKRRMHAMNFTDPSYSLQEDGSVLIVRPYPFEIEKNMDLLKAAVPFAHEQWKQEKASKGSTSSDKYNKAAGFEG